MAGSRGQAWTSPGMTSHDPLRRAGSGDQFLVPAGGVARTGDGGAGGGAGARRHRHCRPQYAGRRGACASGGQGAQDPAAGRRPARHVGRFRGGLLSDRPQGLRPTVPPAHRWQPPRHQGAVPFLLRGDDRGERGPGPHRPAAAADHAGFRRAPRHVVGRRTRPRPSRRHLRLRRHRAPSPGRARRARPPGTRAAGRHQRCPLPPPRPQAARRCARLHPREVHDCGSRLSPRGQRRTAPEERARDGAPVRAVPAGRRPHAGDREPHHLQPRGAALRVPRRAGAAGQDPAGLPGGADLGSRHQALPRRRPRQGAGAPRQGAGTDREARLRALLPHRLRCRALRPRAGQADPVPGPRLGRQQRGVLLPRHHQRQSDRDRPAVRALHLGRPRRAARHRRRLRARAARGGDPVSLCALWPRARRHLLDRDPLPPAHGDPRGGQGPGPQGGRDRGPRRPDLGRGRRRDPRQAHHGGRARSRQPRDPAGDRPCAPAAGLSAPPFPARRRLRAHPRAARRDRADPQRRHGGPHFPGVGQGRHRRARHAQGRRAGARHADGHPQGLRADRAALRDDVHARDRAARGRGRLRDAVTRRLGGRVPGRSRERRCRCCRG